MFYTSSMRSLLSSTGLARFAGFLPVAAILGLTTPLQTGCGSSIEQESAATGDLALRTVAVLDDVTYRLRAATFAVSGGTNVVLSSDTDPNATSIRHDFLPGAYQVTLGAGWYIERQIPNGAPEIVASATLETPATQAFVVASQTTTQLVYAFNVDGTHVTFAQGSLDIEIAVSVETCGDGIIDPGEACDDGNLALEPCNYGSSSCLVCAADCVLVAGQTSYCGDAILDAANGETCDDGNVAVGDGCDAQCVIEVDPPGQSVVGFVGTFAPANWTHSSLGPGVTTDHSSTTISFSISSGGGGITSSIAIPADGVIRFDWNIGVISPGQYGDIIGWVLNGVENNLSSHGSNSGTNVQIAVAAGDVFALRTWGTTQSSSYYGSFTNFSFTAN